MVKVIVGSLVGGLVAGGLALLVGAQDRGGLPPGVAVPLAAQPAGAPSIACAPHQEAAVARTVVNGQELASLVCVDRVSAGYVSYMPSGYVAQPMAYAQPQVMPVAAAEPVRMPVAQPVRRTSARATPVRRVVYGDPDDEVVRYEPDGRERRSVAKTAMIIGGSAGTGAGVGAIVGGKKGALIGAAIGGGAASIYEATKR